MAQRRTECRICKNSNLSTILQLGPMPLANGFLRESQLSVPEQFFPLNICLCNNCGLVQLVDIVPKEILFKNYPYLSSVSKTFVRHCEKLAEEVAQRFLRVASPLVVEIGSNDGILLRSLKKYATILGVEPATDIAEYANSQGIETINGFFSKRMGLEIAQSRGKANVILGLNVVNHLDDLGDIMDGIDGLLADDGVFIFEVPYLLDLVERRAFDTMYHEMHSYFLLKPLLELFKHYDMEIFDVRRIDLHGGSIRVYVQRAKQGREASSSVNELLALEKERGLDRSETFFNFAADVIKLKNHLVRLLNRLKDDDKRIVGYGAAAKGNVLLNYCKIGTDVLDYIVDATPTKQGLYTPGTHIPIYPVIKFREDNPEYTLILPWNFAKEIMAKEQSYMERGGKFIIPIPEPRIVG